MRLSLAVPALLLLLAVAPVAAQGNVDGGTARQPSPWKITGRLEAGAEYDDNVFLLPSNKRDNVRVPSPAARMSGRYDLMPSYSDVIGLVRANVALEGDGYRGRSLSVASGVSYEFFAMNAARRNTALSLGVAQELRRDGRLRLRADYRPQYFARNYLADAVDTDLNGSITPDERRYQRGDHSELGVELDYRHRLKKSRRNEPFEAFLHLGLGYADGSYDAPFSARDFSGPTGSVRFQLSPRRGIEFETSYDVAFLASPVSNQLILLNEQAFGEDFNGNGNATDLRARAVRTVDRSRREHMVSEAVRLKFSRRSELELLVRYRFRTFTSAEPYDVANNGRRDQRLQAGAELTRRVSDRVRFVSALRYGFQTLNRRTDLGAEGAVDDYTKLQAQFGLRFVP